MKRVNGLMVKGTLLLVLIIILGSGSFLTHSTSSSGVRKVSGQTAKPLRIDNRTTALEVVDVQRTEQHVRLTLRNKHTRMITAFSLSLGDYSIEPDFFPDGIRPGQTHVERFTLPPTDKTQSMVSLRAVIFDDGTSEGDTGRVTRILDYRLGKQLAAKSIYMLLQNSLATLDSNLAEALQKARRSIHALQPPTSVKAHSDAEAGFITAKDIVLSDFDQLESGLLSGCDDSCFRRRFRAITEREKRKTIDSKQQSN